MRSSGLVALLQLILQVRVICAEKIAVIGAGSWGTAVALKLIQSNPSAEVALWAFEEVVAGDGRNLTEVINVDRVNSLYLPGVRLPLGVCASSSMESVCGNATTLVVVVPHQFLSATLRGIAPFVDPRAKAVSCIKGLTLSPNGVELLSDKIQTQLGLHEPCAVLMGANVASDVASNQLVEATVACRSTQVAQHFQRLFHSDSLLISCEPDVFTVEVCGALKNVVALGAGFCDGLGVGSSTKAAIMRIGLREMADFCCLFHPQRGKFKDEDLLASVNAAVLQSCGVGDVIASSLGGRNRACAAEFVRRSSTEKGLTVETQSSSSVASSSFALSERQWAVIESELLSGQKLQGLLTCDELIRCLDSDKARATASPARFPLFRRIFGVARLGWAPRKLLEGWGDKSETG